jgi:hypothetical protein
MSDTKETARFLTRYQQWRKGEIESFYPDSHSGPEPKEVTDAIDAAIVALNASTPPADAALSQEPANAARIIEWARSKDRKPANVAFTAGAERQAAYWIEWAESEWETPSDAALADAVALLHKVAKSDVMADRIRVKFVVIAIDRDVIDDINALLAASTAGEGKV